jgi:hypothetical protein
MGTPKGYRACVGGVGPRSGSRSGSGRNRTRLPYLGVRSRKRRLLCVIPGHCLKLENIVTYREPEKKKSALGGLRASRSL